MEIKDRIFRHSTMQYTIHDGHDFDVTEVLGREEHDVVFIYDEDELCVAMFKLACDRGIYAWGGTIWCIEEHDYFDEDELALIAGYIIEQHNKDNKIFERSLK